MGIPLSFSALKNNNSTVTCHSAALLCFTYVITVPLKQLSQSFQFHPDNIFTIPAFQQRLNLKR